MALRSRDSRIYDIASGDTKERGYLQAAGLDCSFNKKCRDVGEVEVSWCSIAGLHRTLPLLLAAHERRLAFHAQSIHIIAHEKI